MEKFKMTDCGEAKYFLGMKFSHEKDSIKISQSEAVAKILVKFGMENCNGINTPLDKNTNLTRSEIKTKYPYRELVGSLMYLMTCTRPDLCYVVGYLSRFQEYAGEEHWIAAKRVLRYLKETQSDGITFRKSKDKAVLSAYADSDWASCKIDRKSVTGGVLKVYGNTVAWISRKQKTIAQSSSEAEYVALSIVASETIRMKGLLQNLGEVTSKYCVSIYEDNMGCIGMANTTESKRAKQIDIKYHFIRDMIEMKQIVVVKISTNDQLADVMTKGLDKTKFIQFKSDLLN